MKKPLIILITNRLNKNTKSVTTIPAKNEPNGKGNRLRGFEQTKKPKIQLNPRSVNLHNAIGRFKDLRIQRKENFPILDKNSMQDDNASRKTQIDFNLWLAQEIARIKAQNIEIEAKESVYSTDWHLIVDKMNVDNIFNENFSDFEQEFVDFPKLYCRVSGLPLAILTPTAIKTALIYYPFLTLDAIQELFANCGNIHPAFYFTHAKAWHIMRKLDDVSAITAIYGINFKNDMRVKNVQALREFFTALKAEIEPTEFNVLIDLLTDLQKINYKWLTTFNDKNELKEQLNACAIDQSIFTDKNKIISWLNAFKHLITVVVRLTIKHKIQLSNGVSPADRLHIENCLDKYGAKNLKSLKPLEGDANIIKRVISVYFREFTIYTQSLDDKELLALIKNAKLFEAKTELAFLNGKRPTPPEAFIKLKNEQSQQALFNRLYSELGL